MTAPGTPWVTRLAGPQPPHIAAAADALVTVTDSRQSALMAAWTLDDAGLLARDTAALVPSRAVDGLNPGGEGRDTEEGVGEAEDVDVCPSSERVDDPAAHSTRFMGDDPYTECVYCGQIRDALTGRVIA